MGLGVANFNEKVLCFGGKNSDGEVSDCFVFDGNEFEPVECLPNREGEDCYLFLDPVSISFGKIYAVSVTGNVFSFINQKWMVLYAD